MAVYYINEVFPGDSNFAKNAGGKAERDIREILRSENMMPISINYCNGHESSAKSAKMKAHISAYREWKSKCSILSNDDILIVQYPPINYSFALVKIFSNLKERGIKIILIIHDLMYLRFQSSASQLSKIRIDREELSILNVCDVLIVHNEQMKKVLLDNGIANEDRMISLQLFDYLLPQNGHRVYGHRSLYLPIAITGNLNEQKAGYIYKLPKKPCFTLYGANYSPHNNTNGIYKGAFHPDNIPFDFDASFGLVWDGPSIETCTGDYGNYLRYNNPHKLSLYLAIGLPAIIWKQAALSEYITSNGLGIAIDRIDEIPELLSTISERTYSALCDRAQEESKKLTTGYFTREAVKRALMLIYDI